METYPWPSDCRTDWQSVPVNLDLRVAQAAQAARSAQGATPAVDKGSVKWRAGFACSRDLLRAWQYVRASERNPGVFFRFGPHGKKPRANEPTGAPSRGEEVGIASKSRLARILRMGEPSSGHRPGPRRDDRS